MSEIVSETINAFELRARRTTKIQKAPNCEGYAEEHVLREEEGEGGCHVSARRSHMALHKRRRANWK